MSFHEDGCGYDTKYERTHNGQEAFLISMFLFVLFSVIELCTAICPMVFSGKLPLVITLIPVWCCLLSTIYWNRMKKIYKEASDYLYHGEELAYFSKARKLFCFWCAVGTPTACSLLMFTNCALYLQLFAYCLPAAIMLFIDAIVNIGIACHFDKD